MSIMCGIAAIIGGQINKEERLKKSLAKITHRGSNILEYKIVDNVILGANRLPIQGRKTGVQPLSNEDETIFAVQNGEIFNKEDLQKSLENKDHKFKTDCDTEILCHLYEEYGKEMVKYIDSEMFAFIIYDSKNKKVYAAKDPLGVKPLYYGYHQDGSIHFASEAKQLTQFEDISEIHNFPKGHYYYDGEFTQYSKLKLKPINYSPNEAKKLLTQLVVNSVKKRVDTDLPIGVFLSGGVDSSLVMEIANRLHPDVTALIVGQEGSSDYEHAKRLCKEHNYKFKTTQAYTPSIDEIKEIAYYTESYEPLINRISIANDLASKLAKQLGLKVVLCGEGSDELFGGYNEFSALKKEKINQGSLMLVDGLERGHLLRVDRLAMKHTVEVRSPFLDKSIVNFALSIPGELKVKKENHNVTLKYILREVAAQFLPGYIAYRYKVPFHTGAGMKLGYNYKRDKWSKKEFESLLDKSAITKTEIDDHKLETLEEKRNYSIYKSYGYNKISNDGERILIKDNIKKLNGGPSTSFLIAEFDFLPIYFPLYYAQELGIYKNYGLDVDFISTGGDDKTYHTVSNNSADIGISDPLFTQMKTGSKIDTKIFAELISKAPVRAVTFNPKIKIKDIKDFQSYTIGSYQKLSTTHTFAQYICGKKVEPISKGINSISSKLMKGDIDIAFVIREDANELEMLGGHLIYDFSTEYNDILYTGLTTSTLINNEQSKKLNLLKHCIKETIKIIKNDIPRATKHAQKLFPKFNNIGKTLTEYAGLRSNNLKVREGKATKSYKVWKSVYPGLMKKFNVNRLQKSEGNIFSKKYFRDNPYKSYELSEIFKKKKINNEKISLVGFRGVGGKKQTDEFDTNTIKQFNLTVEHFCKQNPAGVNVTFLISDKHAEGNGYVGYQNYMQEIIQKLHNNDFKTLLLSELLVKYGINTNKIITIDDSEWSKLHIREKLEKQAKKYNKTPDYIEGAKKYYSLRMIEKDLIKKEFLGSIFFAHTSSDMQLLYPDIPTLYLWSTKKGESKAPWFS